jgi:hypothetical protein
MVHFDPWRVGLRLSGSLVSSKRFYNYRGLFHRLQLDGTLNCGGLSILCQKCVARKEDGIRTWTKKGTKKTINRPHEVRR